MPTKWKIDPSHSEIQFKVKHLMITTVTGYFKEFSLDVETENDGDFTTASKIEFKAVLGSLDTNSAQRDGHLKSDDFFNVDKYPALTFVGKKYEKDGDNAKVQGDLTIRDVTKPVTFNVEFGGLAVDVYGQAKAGFTVDGKINRKDFGLSWDAVTEAGAVVVSNEIRLHGEIQVIRQA